jgi:hypothetical protein
VAVEAAKEEKPPAPELKKAAAPAKPKAPVWTVTSAKLAYKGGRLTKPQYRQIIENLENVYENRIRDLKLQYRAGRISEGYYETQVRAAKMRFKGG